MSNRLPTPAYSESELTNTTPAGFQSPYEDKQGKERNRILKFYLFCEEMSKAAMKDLIEQHVEPLWKALGDAMRERAEMKLRIDALEDSERNLKNLVENMALNNEQLVDDVEKMRIENSGLRKTLNEMETVEQINQLKTVELIRDW